MLKWFVDEKPDGSQIAAGFLHIHHAMHVIWIVQKSALNILVIVNLMLLSTVSSSCGFSAWIVENPHFGLPVSIFCVIHNHDRFCHVAQNFAVYEDNVKYHKISTTRLSITIWVGKHYISHTQIEICTMATG